MSVACIGGKRYITYPSTKSSTLHQVHHADSQPSHYQKMVTLCIKGPSEMPVVFGMVGLHRFYHLTVSVNTISQLNMPHYFYCAALNIHVCICISIALII